mmetsp:Transcript_6504/g.11622  ORF Transcript_6504/g.11622 Transcript_6504/m.11622 type:complete len:83 (-) Transcript_6504:707-955(-)
MQFDRTIKKECKKTTKQGSSDVFRFRLTVAVIDTKSRGDDSRLLGPRTYTEGCVSSTPFCAKQNQKPGAEHIFRARKTIVGL